MAFAQVQGGTLANFTSQSVAAWQFQQYVPIDNVTDGSTTGTATTHQEGRRSYQLNGFARYFTGGNYISPIGGSVSNGPVARLVRASITMRQFLDDVTGPDVADGAREFVKGRIVYTGQALGAVQTTEAPLENETIDLTSFQVPLSSSANTSGNAKLTFGQYDIKHTQGGALWIPFRFIYTGTVTINGTHPFSNTEYTVDAMLNNGKYIDGTVYVRTQTLVIDYKDGMPSILRLNAPFHSLVDADSSDTV